MGMDNAEVVRQAGVTGIQTSGCSHSACPRYRVTLCGAQALSCAGPDLDTAVCVRASTHLYSAFSLTTFTRSTPWSYCAPVRHSHMSVLLA